jgi:hypothetical protein
MAGPKTQIVMSKSQIENSNTGRFTNPVSTESTVRIFIQPLMNTDETQIQKINRRYSTLSRPKLIRMPSLRPVAFRTFNSWGLVTFVVLRGDLNLD